MHFLNQYTYSTYLVHLLNFLLQAPDCVLCKICTNARELVAK